MSEELREKMQLIQSLIEDDEADNLTETVDAFKELIKSDVNHEVSPDDFLKYYTEAMKKYRTPFEKEMAGTLNDSKHAVERKFIEIAKEADSMANSREAQSKKVVKGFGELLNMEAAGGKFPYKSTYTLMGAILNRYKEYGAKEQIKEIVKDSKYGKSLDDWIADNNIQENLNKSDYQDKYDDFAYKLTAAKRWSDSKEYRAIITELESLRDNPLNVLRSDGFRAKEYKGLTDSQLKALPYIRVYTKIEKYLQHKAKDGVNSNAYDKLDLVEQLSKYVGSRIEELNPGSFQYSDPQNSEEKITFDQDQARKVYSQNFSDLKREKAPAGPLPFKEDLDLPKFTNPETETLLNLLAEGEPGAGRSGYDYTNREYYARTYVKDENNYFVPAFPDAGKSDWKGPTEEELYKLAHSDKNFGYFSAGSDAFFIIKGTSSYPASKETDPILFGKDAKRRISKKFSADEAKRYKNEKRIQELKDDLNGFERVRAITTSILGSKMENRGNGTELSFEQRFNKYFSDQPGTVYPTVDSDRQLREDDIAALTMLNITSPRISGGLHPGSEPEVNVLSTFNMSLSDLFIQRSEPTVGYWQSTVTARQDLAKSLKEYYSSGDMTGLAATIADGFHCMTESCQNRSELTGKSASQSIPLVMTMEMLKRGSNKQLLEKTKEIISARGKEALDTFEKDWKKAETLCQLYDGRKKAFESELKLLRYENGQLTDDQGNTLTPTDKEREQLQTDVNRSNFISKLGLIHNNFCHNKLPKEATERMVSEMMANADLATEILEAKKKETGTDYTFDDFMKKRNELNSVSQQRVDNEQTLMPISPVYTVLLEHPQGTKVLDAMLKETPNTEELYQRLEDEGLIPPNGGLDGYDKKSYENNIDLYADWLDAEPQFKKDWETNKDFFQEQGLEYDDVVTLKKAGHIESIESYRKTIEEEEKAAEVRFADNEELPKEEQLNAIKDMLSEGLSERLTAADLCGAFKTINTLSKENEKDPLTVYVASQLMTKVCVKLNDYMSESPEKLMEVREFLKKDDYEKAAYTINRGDAVKKEVEEKIQSRNNEGMSKNGNTKQHVFNK